MKLEELKNIVIKNLENKNKEIKRVFHGRGNFYGAYNYLTIDSLDNLLYICLFEEINQNQREDILDLLESILYKFPYENVILQHRYKQNDIFETLKGEIPKDFIVFENGLKFLINFTNQNIGLFFDMKKGREYIASICEDKTVLNLFSYTCAFSVYAINSNAKEVVNVDMSKTSLTIGRTNHHLNKLNTKKVKFMPYDILKSWSRIKKFAPYDIIIIDPPTFQKGSFAATNDYEKIIKKLSQLCGEDSVILSCLNAPELNTDFIKNKFNTFGKDFKFEKRVDNLSEFKCLDEEKSLKNLIFVKQNSKQQQ